MQFNLTNKKNELISNPLIIMLSVFALDSIFIISYKGGIFNTINEVIFFIYLELIIV